MVRLDIDMKLRPMTPADIDTVAVLERTTYPQPWSEQVFRDELAQPNRVYVVAEEEGRVVGYAGLLLVVDEAHVTTVAVEEMQRGRKVGTRLMLSLIEQARAAGARHLTLEVRVSNRPAQELYRRFGMAPVGVRKNYYQTEDALIMWANDIDGALYADRLAALEESVA